MNTILLGIIFFLLVYSTIILLYKIFDDKGIYAFGPIAMLVANIQVYKSVTLFGETNIPLGNILFASLILCTKLLKNPWSFPILNIVGWMVSGAFLYLTSLYNSDTSQLDHALQVILTSEYYVLIASVSAYLLSQIIYITMIRKITIIPDIISSNIANIIDTFIFSYLFWIVLCQSEISYYNLFIGYMMIPLILRGILVSTHSFIYKMIV